MPTRYPVGGRAESHRLDGGDGANRLVLVGESAKMFFFNRGTAVVCEVHRSHTYCRVIRNV